MDFSIQSCSGNNGSYNPYINTILEIYIIYICIMYVYVGSAPHSPLPSVDALRQCKRQLPPGYRKFPQPPKPPTRKHYCRRLGSGLHPPHISYILYFSRNLSHTTMSTLLVRFDGKFFKCQPPPQPKRYAKEPFPCRAGEDPWSRLARIEHCSIWTYI